MNILVLSDTHLHSELEEKKYRLLKHLITQADQVILNGDFWEGFAISFKQFLNSKWAELFPLLKKKQAVYIYGNHDKKNQSDEKLCSRFSDKQLSRYTLNIGGRTYIFEHGNRLMPFADERPQDFSFACKLFGFLDINIEKFFIRSVGPHYQKLLRKFNEEIKQKLQNELKKNEFYVCGHTHSAEVDEKNRFINTGVFKEGLAQFLHINDKGHTAKQIFYG